MYSADNSKAFKVSAKTKKKWAEMTDRNDHQGVIVEAVQHIWGALVEINAPKSFISYANDFCGRSISLMHIRDERGLTAEESYEAYAILRMAIALVDCVAGSSGVIEIESAIS